MSYNCDNFKLKKLEGFRVPVASLDKNTRSGWQPSVTSVGGETLFQYMDCTMLIGIVESDWLHVRDMDCSGEGSGTIFSETFEPAFADSMGELEAVMVWEGGDSISRFKVKNGVVETEQIEL